jgi:hypothetical protein
MIPSAVERKITLLKFISMMMVEIGELIPKLSQQITSSNIQKVPQRSLHGNCNFCGGEWNFKCHFERRDDVELKYLQNL